ncbi:DUF2490 domain-containing protein [Candidatus Berkiella aquae]|uniref:DUF2490 domain-containing protein n=1 Tax=Candidatus Berkiella aquae TaxID=295108 RepID=A0A0Q9YUE4_9GAMM|nr:DUF2490 domain-containing protein [Candidatus Berkiella aquae]MCS5712229.1 DUF2490 domain-containing protein [Candidatus Berkiella aquae]
MLHKKLVVYLLSFILLLFSQSVFAVEEHAKLWTSYEISGGIFNGSKVRFYLQPQLRFIDNEYKFEQAVVHAGLGYKIAKPLTFYIGNSGVISKQSSGDFVDEYRIWQQLNWEIIKGSHFNVKSRTRLEQRKQEATPQWANRLREKLTFVFPVHPISIIVSDELFFNLNHPLWVSECSLSQNRGFIGFGVPLAKHTSIEIGYLNQYQFNKTDSMSNIVNIGLVTQLP